MLPETVALHILGEEDTAGLHTAPDSNVSRMKATCLGAKGEPCWTCTDKWNLVVDKCDKGNKRVLRWGEVFKCAKRNLKKHAGAMLGIKRKDLVFVRTLRSILT